MTVACETMRLASGVIGYRDSGGPGLPIVMVHGVGGSKEVFEHQFSPELTSRFRMIAFDLPGHGASDDATDPKAQYSVRALTNTTLDVMNFLRLPKALVVGWSLGGHIAIEMMERFPERLAGVVDIGAPPVSRGPLALLRAFQAHPDMLLAKKAVFTTRDALKWQELCFGPNPDGLHFAAILRADGRMRPETSNSLLHGGISNQRRVVETSPVPIAMINGSHDRVMRLNYLDTIAYANLWSGRQHVIEGAGHTGFLSHPELFNAVLVRFAGEMATLVPGPYVSERLPPSATDFGDADEPRSPRRAAR
ncbi:alpha/beta fold hydrolase [Devosia chinhatensis]|uniref:alpha/beta fold hydrolase n=1 Tax=Devosia chinhatensis TaxID=429727 RepID=UPI000A00EDA6|nr:alpha/beta hydrolase [Devosia chinhatensis]